MSLSTLVAPVLPRLNGFFAARKCSHFAWSISMWPDRVAHISATCLLCFLALSPTDVKPLQANVKMGLIRAKLTALSKTLDLALQGLDG